jgi:hypothetical protein
VDAASLEARGLPTAVIGIHQLLDTVGRATAAAHDLSVDRFVAMTGDLHHALDYVPDASPFWDDCVRAVLPMIVDALVAAEGSA